MHTRACLLRQLDVPALIRSLRNDDPDTRKDAAFFLSWILGGELPNEAEVDEDLAWFDEAGAVADRAALWWAENGARFDLAIAYDRGAPASIGRKIADLARLRIQPENPVTEGSALAAALGQLQVWTGRVFEGNAGEQIEAWRAWWREHEGDHVAGQRYFWGRPADAIVAPAPRSG
jgi:hypothetical protein